MAAAPPYSGLYGPQRYRPTRLRAAARNWRRNHRLASLPPVDPAPLPGEPRCPCSTAPQPSCGHWRCSARSARSSSALAAAEAPLHPLAVAPRGLQLRRRCRSSTSAATARPALRAGCPCSAAVSPHPPDLPHFPAPPPVEGRGEEAEVRPPRPLRRW